MAFRLVRCLFLTSLFFTLCISQTTGNITIIPSTNTSNTSTKLGWTSPPNGRGTLDIIWSCSFTMFLSSWSVLCLNVPGPDDTPFRIFRRRVYITALAFLGPEFIFQIALGQWISARSSVKQFHASGLTNWTMAHAFYADMGGFVLYTSDWTPFPIDAKQLHYLVTKGYINFPVIDRMRLRDKNKVDHLLRILTLCQIFWFTIDMAGRRSQGLVITCGELTTAAFIVCSFGTTVCWYYKAADVSMPERVGTDASIAEILLKAGEAASSPYSRTPLDFISRKEWAWSLYWSNWINILRNMGIVFGPQTRPVNRFENTLSLELPGGTKWIFLGMTAIYSSIFVCGWNYSFPTRIEQILWRASAGTLVGTLVAYWLVTEFAFVLYPFLKARFASRSKTSSDVESNQGSSNSTVDGPIKSKLRSVADAVRNNSVSKDPALTVPLKALLPIYVIGFFYCHARTYIFVADIIQLRSLPASAYDTVDWSRFIPHF